MTRENKPLTEFQDWPKIPRYKPVMMRITEKIDGTNAQIIVRQPDPIYNAVLPHEHVVVHEHHCYYISAASRTRFITPESDNYGFARWVRDHAEDLVKLGPGRHYGEWYGAGIQRRYGLDHKRFALFYEYTPDRMPECASVVPTLYFGPYDAQDVLEVHNTLMDNGSHAVPGWMQPEGVVVQLIGNAHVQKITDAVPGKKHVPYSEAGVPLT